LRERPGTGAGIAQIRREPSQIEFIPIGKNDEAELLELVRF
jgi:hypothetical protein